MANFVAAECSVGLMDMIRTPYDRGAVRLRFRSSLPIDFLCVLGRPLLPESLIRSWRMFAETVALTHSLNV